MPVALLAEGVDRNVTRLVIWPQTWVALLAEGVDRNFREVILLSEKLTSPSSRRAWIEMSRSRCRPPWQCVALLAEGVDRNLTAARPIVHDTRRPPRGGRG